MKCKKFLVIGLFTLFLVFCSVLSCSSSYAISDYSVTYSKSSMPTYLFSELTGEQRSQYKYLTIECVSDSDGCSLSNASNTIYGVPYRLNSSGSSQCGAIVVYPYLYPVTYELCTYNIYDPSVSAFPRFQRGRDSLSSNTGDFSINFTLSEFPPAENCPACEECQICPVIPDNPYDPKLDNITMAIYTCGGILLVLYFFYCIYRIIIKNSGVK